MQEQTNGERWEHLRPESWGGTGLPLEQARELDERIRKEGAKAFPLLKQAVEDDAAEAALRHRAMEWLVTLYGNRDLDSKAVVESLMKVARTALRGDRRELRRDALMALGRLHRKSWEGVPEALDLLLALAADESSSQGVREDALLALAETGSPKAIAALALGILEGAWALVRGLHDIQTAQWMDKATVFVDLIEKHPITRSSVKADLVLGAMLPSWGEPGARGFTQMGDYIIEHSRNRSERVAGVMAELLIASVGGDQIQAGHRINEYQKAHEVPPHELESLRAAVGGAPALSGLMGVLQRDLETYFQKPIQQLNRDTQDSWERTVASARMGLKMRLWMSGAVFVVGIGLLVASSVQMLSGGFGLGNFTPFLAGLASMLIVIYTSPLKEIRQAVVDLATANAAFIAYVHRVLETSHTFSFYYLHEKISFEQMERSSAIIKRAMTDTIDALERKARDSSERTLAAALDRLSHRVDDAEPARSGTRLRQEIRHAKSGVDTPARAPS